VQGQSLTLAERLGDQHATTLLADHFERERKGEKERDKGSKSKGKTEKGLCIGIDQQVRQTDRQTDRKKQFLINLTTVK
jgi:hypothetical protein